MAKSILIVDTPDKCRECPLLYWGIDGENCKPMRRMIEDEKPTWCPLKPMPKKKPFATRGRQNGFSMIDLIKNTEWMGWNDCLDEIMGEKE